MFWTVTELVERLKLPRARLRDAVRSGVLPVVAGDPSRGVDDDVLIQLPDLRWWIGEQRGVEPWVSEWEALRGTVYAAGTRPPQAKEGEERNV